MFLCAVGTIPSSLGSLTTLNILYLLGNRLSGMIVLSVLMIWVLCFTIWALYCIVGTVPSTLCDITGLTKLHITIYGTNPLLTCAPLCLTTVTTRSLPSTVVETCPSAEDDGLCGFIAATNIASISNYDEWSCTTDGVTSTDPCAGGSVWTGIECVNFIQLSSLSITGTMPPEIGSLSLLTQMNMRNNCLTGTLPSELGGLSSLVYLYLHANDFSGILLSSL